MRQLIYIPIMHELEDYNIQIQRRTKKQTNYIYIKEYKENLREYWNGVDVYLKNTKIDKIYQDSFSVPADEKHNREKAINEFIKLILSKKKHLQKS